MNKKMIFQALLMLLGLTLPLRADNFSNNFSAIDQPSLDALTKDVGAAMGSGSFHNGKALGFPLGVDLGVHVSAVGVDDQDLILKDDASTLLSQWAQLEVGLPAKINLIGRVGKFEDATAFGGGLRIGLFTPVIPTLPALSITGLYNKATHDMFDATTLSANAVLSMDIPFIHPYIGGGYDHTKVDVSNDPIIPLAKQNLSGTENGYRLEAGVNLSLIPFTYLNLGAGLTNGKKIFTGGFGVKF